MGPPWKEKIFRYDLQKSSIAYNQINQEKWARNIWEKEKKKKMKMRYLQFIFIYKFREGQERKKTWVFGFTGERERRKKISTWG